MKKIILIVLMVAGIFAMKAQTALLNVPYAHEPYCSSCGYKGCAYYSLAMVMKYYLPTITSSVGDLAEEISWSESNMAICNCNNSGSIQDITNYANNHLINATAVTKTSSTYKSAIMDEIDNGNPVIAYVYAGVNLNSFAYRHFIVIVGYDSQNVFINDPGNGSGTRNLSWTTLQTSLAHGSPTYRMIFFEAKQPVVEGVSLQSGYYRITWSDVSTTNPQYRIQVKNSRSGWNKTTGFTSTTATSSAIPVNSNTGSSTYFDANLNNLQAGATYYATVKVFSNNTSSCYCEPVEIHIPSSGSSTSCTNIIARNYWQNTSGSISSQEHSYYKVFLSAGEKIILSTCEGSYGSCTFDSRIDLYYNTISNRVAQNDDDCASPNYYHSYLEYTATNNGYYYVDVYGYGSASGSYSLAYRSSLSGGTGTHGSAYDCTEVPDYDYDLQISTGHSSHSSSIESDCWKLYRVQLVAGSEYTFSTCGSGFDTYLYLYDDEGDLVTSNDDYSDCSNNGSLIAFTTNRSGYYYLKVAAYGSDYGNYTLIYYKENPCVDFPDYSYVITPTTSWTTHSGSTSEDCNFKIYRVDLASNHSYTFKTGCDDGASADFDTYLQLLDDQGDEIMHNDDACPNWTSSITYCTTEQETVYLVASGFSVNDYGNYTLAYRKTPLPSITLSTNASQNVCVGNPISDIIVSGNYETITASGLPDGISLDDNIISGVASTSGTYHFEVTASIDNGISVVASGTITVNELPTMILIASDLNLCPGNATTLYALGAGVSYHWSHNLGDESSVVTSPITTTTYYVTGTSSNGCSSTQSITIQVVPSPSLELSANKSQSVCAGTAINPITVTYSNGSISISNLPSGLNYANGRITGTPVSSGVYTVTVGSENGCTPISLQGIITVRQQPSVSISATQTSVCVGGSTTMTAIGDASNYLWSNDLGVGSVKTVTPTSMTTYSVTGTLNGCSSTASKTIVTQESPTLNIAGDTTFCQGYSTTLTASGIADTYRWSNNSNSASITITEAGVYSVTATLGSCSVTRSKSVSIRPSVNESVNLTLWTAELPYNWRGHEIPVNATSGELVFNETSVTTGCDSIVTLNLTINQTRYTLTVNYLYDDGTTAYPTHSEEIAVGSVYNIHSPEINGYLCSMQEVTGIMPASNVVERVYYSLLPPIVGDIPNSHTIICSGNPLALDTPEVSCAQLQEQGWQISQGMDFEDASYYNNEPLNAIYFGWYARYYATNAAGTTYSAPVQFGVLNTPEVEIVGSNEIEYGESVTLSAVSLSWYTYCWTTGDSTRTITVSPTKTTTYSVRVISSDGCEANASHTVTVNSSNVGIEDRAPQIKVSAYPNPTADYVNIHIDNAKPTTIANVFDSSGKMIMVRDYPTFGDLKIDFRDNPTGTYFINIIGEKEYASIKIIVRH